MKVRSASVPANCRHVNGRGPYLDAHQLAEVAGNARADVTCASANHKCVNVADSKSALH